MTAPMAPRRWLPGSLGGRLLAGAILLVLLAVGGAVLVNATLLHRFLRGQIDARLDAQIVAVASGLSLGPDGVPVVVLDFPVPPFDPPAPGWFWQVEAPGGVARSSAPRGETLALPPDAPRPPHPRGDVPWPADLTTAGGEALIARVSTRLVAGQPVRIIATAPRAALAGPIREMLLPLALSMTGLALLLFGIVVLGVRLGLRPLTALRHEVAEVRAGHAERLATAGRPIEVMPLVAELNALLDENDARLERARRNVANLAHGLKTPLATLGLTLAEPGRDPDRVLGPLVGSMDRQIRHHLARARAAAIGGPGRRRADLAERLAGLALVMSKVHADRGIALTLAIPAVLPVACEEQALDELFGNLLDNAFTHAATLVRVTAAPDGRMMRLTVEDDGPGMGEAEMREALAPGSRLDESTLGYGFGLTISREIAELYGGAIVLSRGALGGLGVSVTLPAV